MTRTRRIRHHVSMLAILGAITFAFVTSCTQLATAAPAFTLTDQRTLATRLSDFRGRPVLLTFLYTNCPDTCPLYLANIGMALRALGDRGVAPPHVLIVTVDPDRDDVARLRDFAKSWPSDWSFLTGTHAEVSGVWKAYGVDVTKRPSPGSSEVHAAHGYTVIHPARLLLVGPDGAIRGELRGEWSADQLVDTLNADLAGSPSFGLVAGALDLARRCGEFAARQPALAATLVILAALAIGVAPGVLHRTLT